MCGILSRKHIAITGLLFTHYLNILYCIHMPCVLIINLYYTSKINIIYSYIYTITQVFLIKSDNNIYIYIYIYILISKL